MKRLLTLSSVLLITVALPARADDYSPYALLPEIMSLDDGALVPPSVYTNPIYDPRAIAASIVQRLHARDEAAANSPSPEMDYLRNTYVQMLGKSSAVNSYIANGFPNQHQFHGSGGAYNPSYRAQIEDVMAHLQLEASYVDGAQNPVNAVRPKYSMLTFTNNNDGQRTLINDPQYGNVVFSFNDAVKQRTTFTPMDSLDLQIYQGNSALTAALRTLFFSSPNEIQKMTLDPSSNQYWEAQIWGKLDFTDLDHIMINCPGSTPPTTDELNALINSTVPVYNCAISDSNSAFVPTGPQLTVTVAPAPAPAAAADPSN